MRRREFITLHQRRGGNVAVRSALCAAIIEARNWLPTATHTPDRVGLYLLTALRKEA